MYPKPCFQPVGKLSFLHVAASLCVTTLGNNFVYGRRWRRGAFSKIVALLLCWWAVSYWAHIFWTNCCYKSWRFCITRHRQNTSVHQNRKDEGQEGWGGVKICECAKHATILLQGKGYIVLFIFLDMSPAESSAFAVKRQHCDSYRRSSIIKAPLKSHNFRISSPSLLSPPSPPKNTNCVLCVPSIRFVPPKPCKKQKTNKETSFVILILA